MIGKYYIIYPGGDRGKLTVVSVTSYEVWKVEDYDLASRKFFTDLVDANKYGSKLAAQHGKQFTPLKEDRHDYLD